MTGDRETGTLGGIDWRLRVNKRTGERETERVREEVR
jgi:hypothetical protein